MDGNQGFFSKVCSSHGQREVAFQPHQLLVVLYDGHPGVEDVLDVLAAWQEVLDDGGDLVAVPLIMHPLAAVCIAFGVEEEPRRRTLSPPEKKSCTFEKIGPV